MSAPNEREESIKIVQRRCQKLGLNESQTDLLVNLLGWNKEADHSQFLHYYGSTSIPEMKEILHILLGDKELQKIRNNPLAAITELYPRLHSSSVHLYAGMWLLAQLSIRSQQPWVRQSIMKLACRPPEEVRATVAFAIEQLLQRREP